MHKGGVVKNGIKLVARIACLDFLDGLFRNPRSARAEDVAYRSPSNRECSVSMLFAWERLSLVGSAAPIATFMATKATGGTDLHPQRSGGPKLRRRTEGGRLFCLAM